MWIQGRLPGDLSVRSICTFCCRIMTAADYGLQNANNWISQFLRILWDKSLSSGRSSREEIISWGTAFWIMGPFSRALSTLSLLKILKLTEKTIPATERQTPNTHREVWPIFCSVFQRTAGCSSNKSPHLQSKLSLSSCSCRWMFELHCVRMHRTGPKTQDAGRQILTKSCCAHQTKCKLLKN